MHQALYRKWRPQVFDDVCGQEHITSVLRYEAEHGAFSHAYLFCGSRGTGKTTCAKILAKVVNCAHPVNGNPCGDCAACRAIDSGSTTDVLEMDAASNNGVDNIRDIRDEVVYSPSDLKYRVYIIDEVHMLSPSAFNALLKTLEEPPEHVIFILATTELQKLPATIISRCQRFDFRRISTDSLVKRLSYIAKEEAIELTDEAAGILAKLSQGGMRDAISLLELCAGGNRKITAETVSEAVGITGRGILLETVSAIANKDYDTLFSQVDEVVRSSKDLAVFWQDLIAVYRDMLVVKTVKDYAKYLDLTDQESAEIKSAAQRFSKETLVYHGKLLEDALFAMQKANAVKRTVAEMALVRLCDESLDSSADALLSRIAKLEDQVAMGKYLPERRSDNPLQQTVLSPIKPKEEPKKESPATVKTANKTYQKMRGWAEIVEKISHGAPMIAGFLKDTRGLISEDGQVTVFFENDFSLGMVEKNDGRDRLRALICRSLGREVKDSELHFEVDSADRQTSVLDEIDALSDQ